MKRISARRILLSALLVSSLFALSGCTGTVYNDRVPVPGLSEGIYTHYIFQAVLFHLLQVPIIGVVLWLCWRVLFPPYYKVRTKGLSIELWVSKRKFPWASLSQGFIVPVAPDLKMNFGSAKIARDWGANRAQYEAEEVAPLRPGDAFIGSGARYRWKHTALAVIFDEQKRTNTELLTQALRTAIAKLSAEEVTSALIPDLTDNLIAQPNWITDEQREETARKTARMMLDALVNANSDLKVARIWVFDPRNRDIFAEEMEKWQEEYDAKTSAQSA